MSVARRRRASAPAAEDPGSVESDSPSGLFEIWRTLVFLGLVKFTFGGNEVSFPSAQWGQAIWALLLAATWFWVAMGLWNVRAHALSFGIYISLFTLICSFFAILGSNGIVESEFVAMFASIIVFMYLNYAGVRNQFMEHEMSLLTPYQPAALEGAQAANAAAVQAMAAPLAPSTPPAPPAPPAPSTPDAPPAPPAASPTV